MGVTVLATNIEVHVKAQEEKREQQKEESLSEVNGKIAALEKDLNTMHKKVSDIDNMENSLDASIKTLNNKITTRIEELCKFNVDMKNQISVHESSQERRLEVLGDLQAEQADKIKALEEASMQHFERATYFDSLNTRVNQLDEMRQQSEAKARDEVDATVSRNNTIVNEFRTDIENQIQNISFHINDEQRKTVEENAKLKSDIAVLKEDLQRVGSNASTSENAFNIRLSQLEHDGKNSLAELIN